MGSVKLPAGAFAGPACFKDPPSCCRAPTGRSDLLEDSKAGEAPAWIISAATTAASCWDFGYLMPVSVVCQTDSNSGLGWVPAIPQNWAGEAAPQHPPYSCPASPGWVADSSSTGGLGTAAKKHRCLAPSWAGAISVEAYWKAGWCSWY